MLNKKQLYSLAKDYLLKNEIPIISASGKVVLPSEEEDLESKEFLMENNIARATFKSIYLDQPDHPDHELDPGVYIVYVDLTTGKVHMPRHM